MNAYNYETQQWVSGSEGDKVSLQQTREELALLRDSSKCNEYAKMIGVSLVLIPSYIATMEAQERRLVRELQKPGLKTVRQIIGESIEMLEGNPSPEAIETVRAMLNAAIIKMEGAK